MKLAGTNCLICNCEKTMPLEANKLSKALGADVGEIHNHLCRSQLARFEAALDDDAPLLVACTQEAPLFQEVAEDLGKGEHVSFINIREDAGWSEEAAKAHPKIAALLKTAQYEAKPARLKSIHSDGLCLVYGSGQQALEMANLLNQTLSVTLLLSDDADLVLPGTSDIPIYRGTIANAAGSFGSFDLTVDGYAPLMPSSRDETKFIMARDGAKTGCSVIYDMSGKAPLFSGHQHRDGYERVDPGDPAALIRAVLDVSDMVGEFEKPIYVDYNAETCAHGRSQKTGCTKCLDVCPAGAVTDAGDIVEIDSGICGGCGSCHAVCPTGSISYQYPQRADLVGRPQALLAAYSEAGGKNPTLLFHDASFGNDMIGAIARHGRGLPAQLLPVAVHSATTMGHVEMAALFASGAERIVFLTDPKKQDELDGLKAQTELCDAILSGLGLSESSRCTIISEGDPDAVETAIWTDIQPLKLKVEGFSPVGGKRDVARVALGKLHGLSKTKPDAIDLPEGAPYGEIVIDQSACTLCMACTAACPASAIIDTPGEPKLRFVEAACVQCGICTRTCPEKALSLSPRLNFAAESMQPVTLYEEEPFNCVECGTPFATKSTIERISGQLAEKHAMFANADRARLIQMCQDCRVEAQANSSEDPFSAGDRPRVRTTEDYIEAERGNRSAEDFLMDD